MGKINDARKSQLRSQVDFAVVEHIGTEANDYPSWDVGTYRVFVPGAIREHNIVKADSEEEAKEKVIACLERKIDNMPETEIKADEHELDPDNMKHQFKATLTTKEDK